MLPDSFLVLLTSLQPCFTAPGFVRFTTLMTGWLLCTGKHTVTNVMRAAGVVGVREHSGFHRFFSRGAWNPADVGLVIAELVLKLVPKDKTVVLTLDDTLARHTGKHIASAGMHRDPLLSCAARPFWHFGHNWVVLAVAVTVPRWNKTFSLPILASLYRTRKVNDALKRPHKKTTELAANMLQALAERFPQRRFVVVADNAYVNRSVVRFLPKMVNLVGRGRMDAALYDPPPAYGGFGRPRVRGKRLPGPAERAKSKRWKQLQVNVYGRDAELRVQTFDALWYIVGYQRTLRFVIIRDWPGHKKDDVLICTDLSLDPRAIIELYCDRWSIEETFGWVKSRLGFQDPHNRCEHAVQRTAPMALWAYSLVVAWYLHWSRDRKKLSWRDAPWYAQKRAPSFADMLATLRRQGWSLWLSDLAVSDRLDQKDLEPLLDVAGYG